MPASPFPKAEYGAQGMEIILWVIAGSAVCIFALRRRDKYYAQKLLTKGERATAKVVKTFTKIHMGPYNSYASSKLSYEFTSNSGCQITKTVTNLFPELQELNEGDTLHVFYEEANPHKNYPEVILRNIVSGKIWTFLSIQLK